MSSNETEVTEPQDEGVKPPDSKETPAPPEGEPTASASETTLEAPDTAGGEDMTEEERLACSSEVRFRAHCVKMTRRITEDLKAVHSGQITAGKQRGEMARTVALLALDQATLQDQFKNKTISRVLADKMLTMAAKEGVETETLQEFAVKHLGPEGLIKTHADDEEKESDVLLKSTVAAIHNESANTNRKRQQQEMVKLNKKSKKVAAGEDPAEDMSLCDPDGVCVNGKMSRENEVLLHKYGIVGNGIKGHPGTIIRLKDAKEFHLSDNVRRSAKAAAAEVCSKKDRCSISEHWGQTMFVYVHTILKDLLGKKSRNAPFYFEELVEDPEVLSARDLNAKQPLLWQLLFRSGLGNMELQHSTDVVKLNGLKSAISKLKQKVAEMGTKKKTATDSKAGYLKQRDDGNGDDDPAF